MNAHETYDGKATDRGRPHITGTGHEAEVLHDGGLNPFPIIPATKHPYGPHGVLATTRLHRQSLFNVCEGSNLAAYTGRHAQDLFVLDCDSWESFQRVGAELDRRGIVAWIRNGVDGGQYWLLCADGEVANAKIGDIDVLGNRKYTLAPPSVHPSGMVYEWLRRDGTLPPVVPLDLLDFLPLRLESTRSRRGREKAHTLPLVADRVLVEQDISDYASNSEAEFASCLSLIGAGYSDADILHFFALFSPPHYLKKGETEFRRAVLSSARAKHTPAPGGAGRAGMHSSVFIGWAESHPWPRRTGITDRCVYLALCQRLRMDGKMPFRASAREVAQLAGVNKETASNALRRLQAAGRIQTDGHDKQAGAALYRLLPVPNGENHTTADNRTVGGAYTPAGDSVRHTVAAHDAWHSRALGKSALACWMTLRADTGLTVGEIAQRTGRARSTIKRAVVALDLHALAHTGDGSQWHAHEASVADLDRIALACGTAGRAESRADRHQDERERHATALILGQIRSWRQKAPLKKSTSRKL